MNPAGDMPPPGMMPPIAPPPGPPPNFARRPTGPPPFVGLFHCLLSLFSECCRPYVCLSVTCVPILSRLKFSAMFLIRLVPRSSVDIDGKFYGDHPRRTIPLGDKTQEG